MSPGGGDSVPAAAGADAAGAELAADALPADDVILVWGADELPAVPLHPAAIRPVPARTRSRVAAPRALAFFMARTL